MEQLDKKIVEEMKAKLEAEKAMLEKELSQIARPTGIPGDYQASHDELGEDREDNATEVEEYSDNVALESNLEKQLKEVNDALGRIANGTYGFCENCGQMLSLDRLRAYPAARMCIQCK